MNTEHGNLDKLKETNPFTVPEGYFEGLTAHIMHELPEKIYQEAPPVTWREKVRPWVYMAAVFAGMGLFLKVLIGTPSENNVGTPSDSLLVQTEIAPESIPVIQLNEEDEDYLEYVEEQYSGYLLKGEIDFSE